jgi:hypothetical protein
MKILESTEGFVGHIERSVNIGNNVTGTTALFIVRSTTTVSGMNTVFSTASAVATRLESRESIVNHAETDIHVLNIIDIVDTKSTLLVVVDRSIETYESVDITTSLVVIDRSVETYEAIDITTLLSIFTTFLIVDRSIETHETVDITTSLVVIDRSIETHESVDITTSLVVVDRSIEAYEAINITALLSIFTAFLAMDRSIETHKSIQGRITAALRAMRAMRAMRALSALSALFVVIDRSVKTYEALKITTFLLIMIRDSITSSPRFLNQRVDFSQQELSVVRIYVLSAHYTIWYFKTFE